MKSFSKKMDTQVNKIKNGLKKIGIAAIAAGVGLAAMTKSAINANDELAKLSTKLGISTEDLSALKFAADFSGTSLGGLDGALSALTRRFNNFDRTGGGAAKDAFIELGIATRDAEGNLRNIGDVFIEISEKVSKMEAGIRKTAIVQDVFSKSQAKIIPLLNLGAEGLEKYKKQAESLGLILSQKTAKASEDFNDKLTLMGKSISGVGAKLAEKLLPTLNKLADSLLAIIASADFDIFLDKIVDFVKSMILAIKTAVAVYDTFVVVGLVIVGQLDLANRKAEKLTKSFSELRGMLDSIGKADASFALTNKTSTPASTTLPAVASPNIEKEVDKIKTFADQIKDFYKTITDLNTQFADAFKSGFQGLEDAILDFTKTGKFSFKDMVTSIVDDLTRIAIKAAIIAPIVNAVTAGFGGGGGGGGILSSIFGGFFAKGGRPDANKASVIGENGPELFIPDTAGRVIPNNKLNQGGSGGNGGGNMSRSEVSININAVDTQTGTAFLISQKDVIAAIFNSSLNSNGTVRANL